jgi:hypothetical protein
MIGLRRFPDGRRASKSRAVLQYDLPLGLIGDVLLWVTMTMVLPRRWISLSSETISSVDLLSSWLWAHRRDHFRIMTSARAIATPASARLIADWA